ncbi:MAG TPA: transglycosylase domain-containing protein, partial [Steroidobacteraceae bacterium]|nr:transglycosylase domain-containing protein [Steroidobacteraceae bacterium]
MARKKRRRNRRRWPRFLALLLLAGAGALALWVLHLDRVATEQFEGRRWTLPAQVYAEPVELYAGRPLAADELEAELSRLGYARVERPERAGTYRRRGGRFDIASREARFWDEVRPAQAISVVASSGLIEGLFDGSGRTVPIFRLDPLLIGSIFPIHGEDRIVLAPEQVPEVLRQALIAVEDRRFATHHGVDPGAILRALFVNVRAGRIEQGGSTLTQQLVRSYFLDNRQTLKRKVREAIMAVILDARFDKDDLLNAYVNEIYLGQDGRRAIHGFGLASQFYFGKPLAELDLHEIALLVTVVRGPSYYDPRRHPERARQRRDMILELLTAQGIVAAPAAEAAAAQPLGVSARGAVGSSYYPAFLDLVRRTLRRDYREEDLTEEGLRIFTTLDPRIQARAEATLTSELEKLDARRADSSRKLEGAVVVTAPQSGDVVAVVGARETRLDGFNRALDARRPIGSLVKPVVYLAALQTGRFHAASIIEDAPVEVRLPTGQTWRPQNINEQTYGPVPVVRALAQSMNLATVQLGLATGLERVARTFSVLGLESAPPPLPSMLLGAVDLSPLEVAQIYTPLANGGFRTPLRAVRAVLDAEGEPLQAFPLEVTPAADPDIVYQLDRMLVEVVERGSGRAARSILPAGLVVAGKTGTS